MSEVVRVFTPGDARRRRRRGLYRRMALAVGVLVILYLMVSSWDRRSYSQFVPKDQKYGVVITDLLRHRDALAQSAVWRALPPSIGANGIPALLTSSTGLPEWVLNNLIGGPCYITGQDIVAFRDVVIITRMTMIGKQLERLSAFASAIENDPAGGLRLRHVRGTSVYFAVRGRLFLLSRSRDALIRSLTLRPEDVVSDDPLLTQTAKSGTEHVRGMVILSPDDPLGKHIRSLRFALRIDAAAAHLRCRVKLDESLEASLSPLLTDLGPKPLIAPPDGMIGLSANLGHPIKDVWASLAPALPYPIFAAQQWEAWQTVSPGRQPGWLHMLTGLLGLAGPGFALSVSGVDQNEMLPLPLLVGLFEAPNDAIQKAAASWPPLPDTAKPWDSIPRYETDHKWIRLPLIGGPSLEPVAAPYGDAHLLFSSSRTVAEAMLTQPQPPQPLATPGNLCLQIKPLDCVQALADAGQQLADSNLLRGYAPDSFRADAARWIEQAQNVRSLSFLLTRDNGELAAQADLFCTTGD